MWGHKGIGKSASAKQVTLENRMGFMDMRCSQIEASDLRGLPDKRGDRTVFLPPADMPRGGMTWEDFTAKLGYPPEEHASRIAALKADGKVAEATKYDEIYNECQPLLNDGILFLDEANRAQDDVLQAAFQLVLDRRVGQYVLPVGWSIVAAGNYTEGYQTNGFTDPAFLDRFCHLILSADDTTLPEWVDYIIGQHGEAGSQIVEFASQALKFLHGEQPKSDLGFSITPSPRSWEAVVRVEKAFRKHDFGQDAKSSVGRDCEPASPP
jgi:MoxR-like ATPase